MELHENLYALGLRLGREVFDDPETFRGALDDFLDEDSATTGDINLLVDAVRLGAFSSMTSMIGSGAQVTAAVEEAGHRLARDRGSADVSGAQWACAVLGFAIGKVSDAEVRRYRTQHSGPPHTQQPMPPTQFPAQQAQPGVAPTQRPGVPMSGSNPTAMGQQPPAQPYGQSGSGGYPAPPGQAPPPGSWPAGPPTKKRKTWPIIVAAAAAVVLIAGGVVAVVATQGDSPTPPTPPPSPTEVPVDLESVQERYSGLAEDATADLDECEAGEAGDGTTEVLECGFANGTLTLTTYEAADDLTAARAATTPLDAGTRISESDAGTVYSVDASSAVSDAPVSSLYWDNTGALQAGHYVASSESVTIDQLVEVYGKTSSPIAYPTEPEDPGMIALAEEFVKLNACDRIQTIQDGELEESICSGPKGITIFMGVFESMKDFKDYRRNAIQQAADQDYKLRTWNFTGQAREGAAAEYINSSGDGVRYWDRPECRCYMEASLGDGDLQTLEDWWVNA
jgi:hypothetical protein